MQEVMQAANMAASQCIMEAVCTLGFSAAGAPSAAAGFGALGFFACVRSTHSVLEERSRPEARPENCLEAWDCQSPEE